MQIRHDFGLPMIYSFLIIWIWIIKSEPWGLETRNWPS
jgi:hypothetical protein